MLRNLLRRSSLGSKSQHRYIMSLISKGEHSVKDLRAACISENYSFGGSFDGVLFLLEWVGLIDIKELVKLKKKVSLRNLEKEIIYLLFLKMTKCNQLHLFLNSSNISFHNSIYVKNNLIPLKFSPIRNLLINFGVFKSDSLIKSQFIIGDSYKLWFIDKIVPLINNSRIRNRSIESLRKVQEAKNKAGIEAENFVLGYERSLMNHRPDYKNISIISDTDTQAGYDILSYQSTNSILLDKLIEVKSYFQDLQFYWSDNEIRVAKEEGSSYFLYLVDRYEMHKKDYSPIVVQDPYRNIFLNKNSSWNKTCQSFRFKPKKEPTLSHIVHNTHHEKQT